MSRAFRNTLQSIRQNRLRSVLAGFGIAWGIFLLVIFLGVGTGFKNGVMSMFNAFAQKSLFIYGGKTSVASSRTNESSSVFFKSDIIQDIKSRYPSVVSCSPEMNIPSINVSCEGEICSANLKGVIEDYFRIKILKIKEGRYFNPIDICKSRNVAIIGEGISQSLFPKRTATGHYVDIGGTLFKVIGILSSDDLFSMQERNSVYIPASSFSSNFDSSGNLTSFCLSLSGDTDTAEIERGLHNYLAYKSGFNPYDDQALYIANIEKQTASFDSLFHGLEILIWVVGVCLLLSGIVGVCNVMLIIVKERTNEIGIRKAVGATSGSIISMILAESVTITFIAGIVGIVLGTACVVFADKVVMPMLDTKIMSSLEIDMPSVIVAFVILCLCGILAGLFPALKASQITPVDAIRYENRE